MLNATGSPPHFVHFQDRRRMRALEDFTLAVASLRPDSRSTLLTVLTSVRDRNAGRDDLGDVLAMGVDVLLNAPRLAAA